MIIFSRGVFDEEDEKEGKEEYIYIYICYIGVRIWTRYECTVEEQRGSGWSCVIDGRVGGWVGYVRGTISGWCSFTFNIFACNGVSNFGPHFPFSSVPNISQQKWTLTCLSHAFFSLSLYIHKLLNAVRCTTCVAPMLLG